MINVASAWKQLVVQNFRSRSKPSKFGEMKGHMICQHSMIAFKFSIGIISRLFSIEKSALIGPGRLEKVPVDYDNMTANTM